MSAKYKPSIGELVKVTITGRFHGYDDAGEAFISSAAKVALDDHRVTIEPLEQFIQGGPAVTP